jgi:hypothetical protein
MMAAHVVQRCFGFGVEFDNGEGQRREARRLRHAEGVDEGDVGFTRPVELKNAGDAEALLESFPDFRAQAVAGDGADAVVAVARAFRPVQQVAQQLADIAEDGGIVVARRGPRNGWR